MRHRTWEENDGPDDPEDASFDTFGDADEPAPEGKVGFAKLWGDRLGKDGGAGEEMLARQQLNARCALHVERSLKLVALINSRAQRLTGSEKIRGAPGTLDRINFTLPELPFYLQSVWREDVKEPRTLDALGASDASLPCTLYEIHRDEYLESRPDPQNRPFCAMFAMPKRQAFLTAFLRDEVNLEISGFPALVVPRKKHEQLVFVHSGALLRHLKEKVFN